MQFRIRMTIALRLREAATYRRCLADIGTEGYLPYRKDARHYRRQHAQAIRKARELIAIQRELVVERGARAVPVIPKPLR